MKKTLIILAMAALTASLAFVSCGKDETEKKGENKETVLEDPVNDPNSPVVISRYVKDDDGNPINTPLGDLEFDGNDYFLTLFDTQNVDFVNGEVSQFSAESEKGDVNSLLVWKTVRHTYKNYLVAVLRPRALGSCIIALKYVKAAGDTLVMRAKVNVVRTRSNYLGAHTTGELVADRIGFGTLSNFTYAWKDYADGKLSIHQDGNQENYGLETTATGITATLKPYPNASSPEYWYYSITKNSGASFYDAPVKFTLESGGKTYTKIIVFTTYGFDVY